MGSYEIGLSSSASSGANAGAGDFIVTGGGSGGLASVLPKVSTDKAWIVWVVGGVAIVAGLLIFLKR